MSRKTTLIEIIMEIGVDYAPRTAVRSPARLGKPASRPLRGTSKPTVDAVQKPSIITPYTLFDIYRSNWRTEALSFLQRRVELNPKDGRALFGLWYFADSGNFALLKKAYDIDPSYCSTSWAGHESSEDPIFLEKEDFERLTQRFPDDAYAHFWLGQEYVKCDFLRCRLQSRRPELEFTIFANLPAAKEEFQQAIGLDPNFYPAYSALGFCHLLDDSICPTVHLTFDKSVFREVTEPIQRAANLDPNHAYVHAWLSLCHLGLGDINAARKIIIAHPEAHTLIETMSDGAKRSDSLRDTKTGAALSILLGDVRMGLEEDERALRKAIELYPNNIIAHYHLGELLLQRGSYGEAEVAFKRAIGLDPNSLRPKSLLEYFRRTIVRRGNYGLGLKSLYECYLKQSKLEEAEDVLDAGDHIIDFLSFGYPTENPDLRVSLYSELGDSYVQQDKLERAASCYYKALKISKEGGRCPDAFVLETSLERLAELKPDYASAHFLLGELNLVGTGREEFEKAIELGPKTNLDFYILGLFRAKEGQYREARAALKRAAKLGNEDAKAILANPYDELKPWHRKLKEAVLG